MLKNFLKLKIVLLILGGALLLLVSFLLIFNSFSLSEKHHNYHYSQPSEKEFFEMTYQFRRDEFDLSDSNVVAGIIPHHLLAGDLIANFFANLEGKDYDLVALIGPNHFGSGQALAISSNYVWKTPYGELEADIDAIELMTQSGLLELDNEALVGEHSIASAASYIKKTFPRAKLLPIILRDSYSEQEANDLANYLNKFNKRRNILVLASADFSHYKTSQEAQLDDAYSLEVLRNMDLAYVYNMAVDSPAAIYTVLLYSQLNDAQFKLQKNTNSALLVNREDIDSTTSYVTGYFIE